MNDLNKLFGNVNQCLRPINISEPSVTCVLGDSPEVEKEIQLAWMELVNWIEQENVGDQFDLTYPEFKEEVRLTLGNDRCFDCADDTPDSQTPASEPVIDNERQSGEFHPDDPNFENTVESELIKTNSAEHYI